MASCYWQLCNCPDQQACLEHTGFFCGLWNGTQITNPGQVADTVTREAELGLARLTVDGAQLDRIRIEIEAKRLDLENTLACSAFAAAMMGASCERCA